MSARLEVTPTLWGARGVQHVLQRQLAAAASALTTRHPDQEHVHGARKCLKAARSALRLLRPALGERAYRAENRALRNAGRQLSIVRDGTVLLGSLGQLRRKVRDRRGREQLEELTAQLRTQAARDWKHARRFGIPRAGRAVRTAAARVARWAFAAHDWQATCDALLRIYRKGRREAARNRHSADSDSLHEWRKSTRYLRNQLLLLRPLQHASLAAAARELHRLDTRLGDDHDLAVLSAIVRQNAARSGTHTCSTLEKAIRRRRRKLQQRALSIGKRVYAEKPAHFAARLRRYIDRWPEG